MSFNGKKEKRSPLKDKPLHNPGESLQQEINRLLYEDLAPHVYQIIFVIIIVAWEWWRAYWKTPPQPVLMTIFGILFGGYSIYKIVVYFPQLRNLWLGAEGEKLVGQELNLLQGRDGYHVFHDIPSKDFNVDHVIISNRGIYLIETKTFSKSIRGNPKITYDGEQILVDGQRPERDPIRQALALRQWLIKLLEDRTSRRFPVRAVIVFPGWFVEKTKPTKRDDLWVLNPKGVPKFIENEPVLLKPEDVALASFTLSSSIQKYDE